MCVCVCVFFFFLKTHVWKATERLPCPCLLWWLLVESKGILQMERFTVCGCRGGQANTEPVHGCGRIPSWTRPSGRAEDAGMMSAEYAAATDFLKWSN